MLKDKLGATRPACQLTSVQGGPATARCQAESAYGAAVSVVSVTAVMQCAGNNPGVEPEPRLKGSGSATLKAT